MKHRVDFKTFETKDLVALEPSGDRAELNSAIMQIMQFAVTNKESISELLIEDGD